MKDPWMGDENEYRYKYNGIEEVDDFGLDLSFATFRTLDPSIGRWLQVDPYASSFASINPYNSMGNNPISIVDPNGDFIGNVVGAAVGVAVNGIGNTIKGDPFFQGWVGAAIAGAASGGAAGGAISGVNGHLPSFGLNVGNLSLSISPALMLGDVGFGIGANVGASLNTDVGSIGLSSSYFKGGGFSQKTGGLNIGGDGWGVAYENDWMFGTGAGDGGDRWRTGALRASLGDISVGVNIFTGDPGNPKNKRVADATPDDTGQLFFNNGADNYRGGILTVGYKNSRIGINSEDVRAGIQNTLHKWKGDPYFRNLKNQGYPTKLYGSYQTSNPYTLW